MVLEPGERYSTYSRFCRAHPDPQELASKLYIPGRGFVLNAEGAPWKLLRKNLTTLAQTWSVLSYSNLAPTSHTSDLNMDRVRLVYGLGLHYLWSDLTYGPVLLFQAQISGVITVVCITRGVVLDSLTFESLSPAINLAYIRKNC